MRHLKKYKTFELKDETYLSAADKLQDLHPSRARKLRNWVDDKQSVDIDYLDPRQLMGTGRNRYYITSVEKTTSTLNGVEMGNNIEVKLESVNRIVMLTIPNYDYVSPVFREKHGYMVNISKYRTPWGMVEVSDRRTGKIDREPFWFLDRKSAKAFIEIVEEEAGEKLLFSVNYIYMS